MWLSDVLDVRGGPLENSKIKVGRGMPRPYTKLCSLV
jgi:hypothetical protein